MKGYVFPEKESMVMIGFGQGGVIEAADEVSTSVAYDLPVMTNSYESGCSYRLSLPCL